jgi:hypothetical protein
MLINGLNVDDLQDDLKSQRAKVVTGSHEQLENGVISSADSAFCPSNLALVNN